MQQRGMLNRCLTRPITTEPHDVVIFADTPIVATPAYHGKVIVRGVTLGK
jgi:hypothetical protein